MYNKHYTLHDLNKWVNSEFEKLGWMILALEYNKEYKIINYKKNLDNLIEILEHALEHYEDNDRKRDVLSLWYKIKSLRSFVSKNFRF